MILVTGAAGYIGAEVCNKLALSSLPYCVIVRKNAPILPGAAVTRIASIESFDYDDYIAMGKPKVLLHLAWSDGFDHANVSHIINLAKHYEFISKLVKFGVEQVVVMGSMHEVGYWEGPIGEKTPCNPMSLYGISKNSLRQSLLNTALSSNVIVQWIRAYYIIGNDIRSNSVFGKILKSEIQGMKSFPFTSGESCYDFINLHELATQIVAVISQKAITGVINCCSGVPIRLRDKVEEFVKVNKLSIKPSFGDYPSRPYDSPIVYGDATEISEIMRLYTNTSLSISA